MESERQWQDNTPAEGGTIWNPAYFGTESGGEMRGDVGDYLFGVCLENKKVFSPERKQFEYHILIGSAGEIRAEATLRGEKLGDDLFRFICGKSRARLGATTEVGKLYTFRLVGLKNTGEQNLWAEYSRTVDPSFIMPEKSVESGEGAGA